MIAGATHRIRRGFVDRQGTPTESDLAARPHICGWFMQRYSRTLKQWQVCASSSDGAVLLLLRPNTPFICLVCFRPGLPTLLLSRVWNEMTSGIGRIKIWCILQDIYFLNETEAVQPDFDMMNFWHANSKDSLFTQVCRKPLSKNSCGMGSVLLCQPLRDA